MKISNKLPWLCLWPDWGSGPGEIWPIEGGWGEDTPSVPIIVTPSLCEEDGDQVTRGVMASVNTISTSSGHMSRLTGQHEPQNWEFWCTLVKFWENGSLFSAHTKYKNNLVIFGYVGSRVHFKICNKWRKRCLTFVSAFMSEYPWLFGSRDFFEKYFNPLSPFLIG